MATIFGDTSGTLSGTNSGRRQTILGIAYQTNQIVGDANAIIQTAGSLIGQMLASVVNFFNPSHVFIGGGITRIGPTAHLPPSPSQPGAPKPPAGERERLIWAMEQCGWVQAKAARLLRLTPRQLGYALLKNRIEVRKF